MKSIPIEAKFLIQLQVSELRILIEKSLNANSNDKKNDVLNLTVDDDERVTNLSGQQLIDIICELKKIEPEPLGKKNIIKQELFEGIDLINRHEVAEYFRVSLVTIDKWIKKELIPKPIKIGGAVYFNRNEMNDYIKNAKKR